MSTQQKPVEKFILTVREIHLGFVKETFKAGSVIVHDPNARRLIINGRRFDDTRDLDLLKNQARKHPDNPWVVPYTEETLARIQGVPEPEPALPESIQQRQQKMPVVQSDEDSHQVIDISHTQVSKRKQEAAEREAAEKAARKAGASPMPVVPGHQTVEERIAELSSAKSTDINAASERVRLKSAAPAKMTVVHDDSLGSVGGSAAAALNAGQPVSGKRAEEASESVSAAAEARKAQDEANRQRVLAEEGLAEDEFEVGALPDDGDDQSVVEEAVTADDKDAEIARLKAALEAPEPEPEPDPRDAEIARLKALLAEKEAKGSRRVPVTDKQEADKVLAAAGVEC